MNARITVAAAVLLTAIGFLLPARAKAADHFSDGDKALIKDTQRNLETGSSEGRLARDHSENDDVKDLAEKIVGGHDKLTKELRDMADAHDFTFNAEPTKPDAVEIKSLEALHGKAFDHKYLNDTVAEHEQMILIFKKGADSADNKELRKWYDDKLEVIRDHQEKAKALRDKIDG